MSDIIKQILAIRPNVQKEFVKPHKYLVLLLALRKLRETQSSAVTWNEDSSKLESLIEQFNNKSKINALNPFFRLKNDGIWEINSILDADSNISEVRRENPVGKLTSSIEAELLNNYELTNEVIRQILAAAFSDSFYEDVLTAVGFDSREILFSAPREILLDPAKKRDSQWPAKILQAWESQCAFCGYDGKIDNAPVGIDAAHVRWFNQDGPDEMDNGLALCSLHHRLLDRGVIGFKDPETLTVSKTFSAVTESGKRIYELLDVKLKPRSGTVLPAEKHVEWHKVNIFRGESI
ncbi:MAG: hypothetical protein RLZZ330_92 [Actinomycetota bacterium]